MDNTSHPERSGRHGFPLRYFAAAFAISILATVFGGWELWYMHNRDIEMSNKHMAIKESAARIMQLDEALTMSARMVAATGDFSYEKRYELLDSQLTEEINAVRAVLPDAELKKFIAKTDEANLALVKMERQAFALAHQGKLREATALLADDDYMRLKEVYAVGAENTNSLVNDFIERDDRDNYFAILKLMAVDALSVLALLAAWFLAIRAARSWASERGESEEMLRKAHDELEFRVEQRTADLFSANELLNKVNLELNRNQALLNEAQRLGHLGSWELDLPSGELKWSDEIFRIFELDPARFSPSYENFLNAIHPDDRDMVNQAYTQSLENHQPYDVVHRLLLPDGRIKWVHEHCTSDFDESGKPLRSMGAVQDVTEQHLAEEQLRIAAATFETQEAILIADKDANILRVNSAFEDLTGYRAEYLIGRNPRVLQSGRHDKVFYQALWSELLGTGKWAGEIWDKRKNGEIYPKWMTITAVYDERHQVTHYVGVSSDITQRKLDEEKIYRLAFYDSLTGLPNRRLLLDRLQQAMAASMRSGRHGALLFIDLDKFKPVNDEFGHEVGDLLLKEVAKRLQYCVRGSDTASRMGGDEFVVLLLTIEEEQDAMMIAEKICHELNQPFELAGHSLHISSSIGVAIYPEHGSDEEQLLKNADTAMYHSKKSGRNNVKLYQPGMHENSELK